ncbi:MAG: phosphoadenosine phosphosulfate reductase family protein, partial [Planctomycetes bacterium]|nr:phosphoadenosine phosphosulfate reductase family protein [Planctomycetota bacterium]
MSELETDVQELLEETRSQSAEELVQTVLARFGERVALASSLSVEDQVLTDMMCQTVAQPKIFTLDTGRLPQETFDVIEGTRKKYGIEIEIIFPERDQVERMVRTQGPNLFYQ